MNISENSTNYLKPSDIREFDRRLSDYLFRYKVKKVNYLPRNIRFLLADFLKNTIRNRISEETKQFQWHVIDSTDRGRLVYQMGIDEPIGVVLNNAGNIIN